MRVLVTGANGMLGVDLCGLFESEGHEVVRTDAAASRTQAKTPEWEVLDITDSGAVRHSLLEHQPDVVIHAAALTDVDGCERDPEKAYHVNGFGTWNVAAVCGAHNITMTYISTDFVFDGEKRSPYTEFCQVNPVSHYGGSKLAGERLVAQLCRRHFIIRTAWLFGVFGKSFPGTILDLSRTRATLPVVTDEVGSPTYTLDLAAAALSILSTELYGTYHVTNAGQCSRYEMACRTLELAGVTSMQLQTITRDQYSSPTRRPAYSVLRRLALEMQGRDNLPPWQNALERYVARRNALSAG